jgi:hypothetical protein
MLRGRADSSGASSTAAKLRPLGLVGIALRCKLMLTRRYGLHAQMSTLEYIDTLIISKEAGDNEVQPCMP